MSQVEVFERLSQNEQQHPKHQKVSVGRGVGVWGWGWGWGGGGGETVSQSAVPYTRNCQIEAVSKTVSKIKST